MSELSRLNNQNFCALVCILDTYFLEEFRNSTAIYTVLEHLKNRPMIVESLDEFPLVLIAYTARLHRGLVAS